MTLPLLALPVDAQECILRALSVRTLLLSGMTCTALHKKLQDDAQWSARLCTEITVRETDMPRMQVLRALPPPKARRLCALLTFTGCERCRRRLTRKVYMPFMIRLCRPCYVASTVRKQHIQAAYPALCVSPNFYTCLDELPRREAVEKTMWGMGTVCVYLRTDIQAMARGLGAEHEPNFSGADTLYKNALQTQTRRQRLRQRNARWRLVEREIGALLRDLSCSEALRAFVEDGKGATLVGHTQWRLPYATMCKIQRELFVAI